MGSCGNVMGHGGRNNRVVNVVVVVEVVVVVVVVEVVVQVVVAVVAVVQVVAINADSLKTNIDKDNLYTFGFYIHLAFFGLFLFLFLDMTR